MALATTFKTCREMLEFIRTNQVHLLDCCFADAVGLWHHCSFHVSQVDEKTLKNGFAFDGSSIRMFSTVDCSDMAMVPDPTTCWIDPFQEERVLHVTCDIVDPYGKESDRCPRGVAKRCTAWIKSEGIADVRAGKTATFMPKPLIDDNGSGMHSHQSLWKDGKNLFFDSKAPYMKLSQVALWYIGGLLKHARAVMAFTNSTTNSYKRLVRGYEAPSNLTYSKGNRSAAIRIPLCDEDNPKAKRLEFRCPDAAGSPYLSFAAMVMAGIDGVRNKIDPPEPLDCDSSAVDNDNIPNTPKSLKEALDALERDHQFLLEGKVFSLDFIKAYVKMKRSEIELVETTPHPREYELYYHC